MNMGAFMLIIVFGIAAMAANFFLRHQFGKKYPEVDSGQVISLAVVQIATIVYFFVSIFGIMGIGAEAYLYNRPISEAEDDAMGLYAISSLLGGIVMTVVSILLCYKIFNFPKNNKKQISTLAITNTIVASVVCIIHIISSFTLNTYGILICAIIIIGTLVYFQRPFTSAVERMYRSKYNESIQSIVVKNITKIAENTSQSYHSVQPSPTSAPAEGTKRCPYCGEIILAVAKKCKHCGEWQNQEKPKTMIKCSICGEDADASLDICPHCGEKLSEMSN